MDKINEEEMIKELKGIGAAYKIDGEKNILVYLLSDTKIEKEGAEFNFKKQGVTVYPEKYGYEVFALGNRKATLLPKST